MVNQWCRLYRETISDPKLSRLTAAQRHVWTVLMCLAIDGDGVAEIADGVGYVSDEIANLAGADADETRAALEWFERVGMISTDGAGVVTLLNWDRRQFKSDRDSAERQRLSRSRRGIVSRDTDGTLSRDSHVTVTHQNRDRTDTDTEQTQRKSARKRAPRVTFIKPTLDEVQTYCRERGKGIDPEAWIAYYEANGWRVGRNPMKDWRAAVRTWERRRAADNPKAHQAGAHVTDPTWMLDTYRRADHERYRDHEAWIAYTEWAAGEPPRSAAGFEDWLGRTQGETV